MQKILIFKKGRRKKKQFVLKGSILQNLILGLLWRSFFSPVFHWPERGPRGRNLCCSPLRLKFGFRMGDRGRCPTAMPRKGGVSGSGIAGSGMEKMGLPLLRIGENIIERAWN